MFGIKKTINLSNNNDFETTNQSSNNNSNDDSKYIYYEQNNKNDLFISQLEIYINPNNYPNQKVLVMVKKDVNFEDLYKQIEQNFKSRPEFKTISNLRIKNYTKIEGEQRIKLPERGNIEEYLKSGDIIYCDILSEEEWIKTYFKFETKDFKKAHKLEYKILKKLSFKMIKIILLKAGLSLFYEELKNNNLDNTFNYYLKDITFYRKKKKQKNVMEKGREYRLEIFIIMNFEIFEELIHEQLILNNIDKNNSIYFRFNEYSNLNFEELMASNKFLPELEAIKDISKQFLTSQFNDIKTPFLFFNPKNPEIFENFFFSYDDNLTSEMDLKEIEDDSNFFSEDKSFSFGTEYGLRTSFSFTSSEVQYKPDANMIIISIFLYSVDSQNSNSSIKRDTIISKKSEYNLNGKGNNILTMDDHKINNPLYDSLLYEGKNENKSLLNHDDTSNAIYNNNNDFIENKDFDILENIIISSDDDSKNKSKKDSKTTGRTTFNLKSKKNYKFLLNKYVDCSNDLYDLFNQKLFLDKIKQNYNLDYNKVLIERTKVPESRNLEIVDKKKFYSLMRKREKTKRESKAKYHKKLIIFLIIVLIYFILFMVFVNNDEFRNHIS